MRSRHASQRRLCGPAERNDSRQVRQARRRRAEGRRGDAVLALAPWGLLPEIRSARPRTRKRAPIAVGERCGRRGGRSAKSARFTAATRSTASSSSDQRVHSRRAVFETLGRPRRRVRRKSERSTAACKPKRCRRAATAAGVRPGHWSVSCSRVALSRATKACNRASSSDDQRRKLLVWVMGTKGTNCSCFDHHQIGADLSTTIWLASPPNRLLCCLVHFLGGGTDERLR